MTPSLFGVAVSDPDPQVERESTGLRADEEWLPARRPDDAASKIRPACSIGHQHDQIELCVALTPQIRGKLTYFAGGCDPVITLDELDAIDDALSRADISHELVVYPYATHGFFCDQSDTFDQAAHDDSWHRVLTLLSAG